MFKEKIEFHEEFFEVIKHSLANTSYRPILKLRSKEHVKLVRKGERLQVYL
jgi:hypothetical protein